MLVQYVGLFMGGLHAGLLIGLLSLLIADHLVETSPTGSVWLCVGVLLASALTFAVLNLYFRKGIALFFLLVAFYAYLSHSLSVYVLCDLHFFCTFTYIPLSFSSFEAHFSDNAAFQKKKFDLKKRSSLIRIFIFFNEKQLIVISVFLKIGLTVLGTTLYGGAIITASIDYFVERLTMVEWIWDRISLKPVAPPPCWFSWIILGVWPSLVVTGLIVQCAVTGRGIHHADSKSPFFLISLRTRKVLKVSLRCFTKLFCTIRGIV